MPINRIAKITLMFVAFTTLSACSVQREISRSTEPGGSDTLRLSPCVCVDTGYEMPSLIMTRAQGATDDQTT